MTTITYDFEGLDQLTTFLREALPHTRRIFFASESSLNIWNVSRRDQLYWVRAISVDGDTHTFWSWFLRVPEAQAKETREAILYALAAEEITPIHAMLNVEVGHDR